MLPRETVALLERIHEIRWTLRWLDYNNAVHIRVERGSLGYNTVLKRRANESMQDVKDRVEAIKPKMRKCLGLNF